MIISTQKVLLCFLLMVFAVLVLFSPPTDPDFGWHYKYGEYFVTNHSLLKNNIFSYNFTNYKWANSYWLSEVFLYTLFHGLGAVGAGFVISLFASIFVLVSFLTIKVSFVGKIIGVLLTVLVFELFGITFRPLLFSSLFFLVLMRTLLASKKHVIYLPILFTIWANFHADFVLGLFIFGVYILWQLYSAFIGKTLKFKTVVSLFFPLILSALITLLNPYGINLWKTLLKEANPTSFNSIAEWLPPNLSNKNIYYFLSFLYAVIFFAFWQIVHKYRDFRWIALCALSVGLLSVRSVYFMRIFFLISVYPLAFFWGRFLSEFYVYIKSILKDKLSYVTTVIFVLLIFSVLPFFISNISLAQSVKNWSGKSKYPFEAVRFLKWSQPKGRMFNTYNWGGYLIWQLPEYKTFIDGRMPSWQDEAGSIFDVYNKIKANPKENYSLLNFYKVNFVLDFPDSALVKYLRTRNDWQILYKDSTSIIITRIG